MEWTWRTFDMDGHMGEVVEIKEEVVDIDQSTLAVAQGDETSGYAP